MVRRTELWERTSATGNRYFSGYLGTSQALLFLEGEKPHPTRPDETVVLWDLLVQERQQQPVTRTGTRGQRTHDRSRDVARHVERSKARQAGEALLRAAGRSKGVNSTFPDPRAGWIDNHEAAIASGAHRATAGVAATLRQTRLAAQIAPPPARAHAIADISAAARLARETANSLTPLHAHDHDDLARDVDELANAVHMVAVASLRLCDEINGGDCGLGQGAK